MSAKLLIVEDDLTIRTLLEMAVRGAGYEDVTTAATGDEGLRIARAEIPDLVLLDVMLPGVDGLKVASRIRSEPKLAATHIIMLTARTMPSDIVRGLEAGADDYVTKPYDREVLLARIRAVLRRGLPIAEGVDMDGLKVDVNNKTATYNGQIVELTAGEFELLLRLIAHRGRIFQRPLDERTVDVQIAALRKKLAGWAKHIETVRGVGYRVSW